MKEGLERQYIHYVKCWNLFLEIIFRFSHIGKVLH